MLIHLRRSVFGLMGFITCTIEAVCTSDHLLQNLRTNVLHVLSDLDASGLDHEHILVHCRQRRRDAEHTISYTIILQ